ncbi:hypothetical protein B0T16DRAFT_105067 [Cercophora newfieldiana]|uniref:Uncharacterized protein n=1 Tax=Cercophora newfieldiana TaxID=92897 RepID=A0AA40CW15_9PEZI|nr:hypothetical protein B0T16DRAFT_105067 [Cercophora newfieldiana]
MAWPQTAPSNLVLSHGRRGCSGHLFACRARTYSRGREQASIKMLLTGNVWLCRWCREPGTRWSIDTQRGAQARLGWRYFSRWARGMLLGLRYNSRNAWIGRWHYTSRWSLIGTLVCSVTGEPGRTAGRENGKRTGEEVWVVLHSSRKRK